MSLRFSPDEALAMGIITKDVADSIKNGSNKTRDLAAKKSAPAKSKPKTAAAKVLAAANDPQTILYDALVKRLPANAVEWEVPDLIEGRKYRVDILLGGRIIVEMDGFAFHRSKEAFQKDRLRQNLFAAQGYYVFRTFTKEIFDAESREALVELLAGAYFKLADDAPKPSAT